MIFNIFLLQQPDNCHRDTLSLCMTLFNLTVVKNVYTHTICDITERTHRVTINNKIF